MPLQTTHSDELQEIMGRIPGRVVRRGTGVIFVILAIILALSWLVKYPEVVSAPVVITTLNPPADLVAHAAGKIEKIFVADGQQVMQEQPIAQIDTCVITAPTAGEVVFTNYWTEKQTIQAGERFAVVISSEVDGIIGKMIVPSLGLGKVKVGQTVHVKLRSHPYTEFGMLVGRTIFISSIPEDGGYPVVLCFPSGLVSTYDKTIEPIHQMDGTAEIVTRDMRLIERFFAPVRSLVKNN